MFWLQPVCFLCVYKVKPVRGGIWLWCVIWMRLVLPPIFIRLKYFMTIYFTKNMFVYKFENKLACKFCSGSKVHLYRNTILYKRTRKQNVSKCLCGNNTRASSAAVWVRNARARRSPCALWTGKTLCAREQQHNSARRLFIAAQRRRMGIYVPFCYPVCVCSAASSSSRNSVCCAATLVRMTHGGADGDGSVR